MSPTERAATPVAETRQNRSVSLCESLGDHAPFSESPLSSTRGACEPICSLRCRRMTKKGNQNPAPDIQTRGCEPSSMPVHPWS